MQYSYNRLEGGLGVCDRREGLDKVIMPAAIEVRISQSSAGCDTSPASEIKQQSRRSSPEH